MGIVAIRTGDVARRVHNILVHLVRAGRFQNRMGADLAEFRHKILLHHRAIVAGKTILLFLRIDEKAFFGAGLVRYVTVLSGVGRDSLGSGAGEFFR